MYQETPLVPWRQQGERPVVRRWRSLCLSPSTFWSHDPQRGFCSSTGMGNSSIECHPTPDWWKVCLCHLLVMRPRTSGPCLGEWDSNGEHITLMSVGVKDGVTTPRRKGWHYFIISHICLSQEKTPRLIWSTPPELWCKAGLYLKSLDNS